MPKPKKAPRFGGTAGHHNLILSNLTTELIRHGRIRTTHARAKSVQPLAEKMITFAKRGDLHARRQVGRIVRDQDVVHKLFADVGPAFAERNGGYTRILKLGPRKGDAAPMVLVELVAGVSPAGEGALEEAPARRWSLRRRRGGTLSATAQEREVAEAAAFDRGDVDVEEGEPVDEDFEEEEPEEPEATEAPDVVEDEERPEADPAEVERRLAAEEAEADEGPAPEAEEPEATEADEADTDDDEERS